MIGTGTLVNVAAGSGLKVAAYAIGRVLDGFFETVQEKGGIDHNALQSGSDTACDYTKHTRRVIAWMFTATLCFVIAIFALDSDAIVPMLIDKERGIFGYLFGGTSQTVVHVTKAQMIMTMWTLGEIMFGFFFTKIGNR